MKTIKLKKSDAFDFFGSYKKISEISKRPQSSLSVAGEYLPESIAWPLWYASKSHKYRKNKLNAEIMIDV
jgi:hypothetical protein